MRYKAGRGLGWFYNRIKGGVLTMDRKREKERRKKERGNKRNRFSLNAFVSLFL